jgi:hypothetical protein
MRCSTLAPLPLLVSLAGLGCAAPAGPDADPAVDRSPAADTGSPVPAVQAYLEQKGYTVTNGTFAFVPCTKAPCAFNNPSTPYGMYCFDGVCATGSDFNYQLGPGDAIVFYSILPSGFTYMSFRSYLVRDADGSPVKEVFASLGDSTNERTPSTYAPSVPALTPGQPAAVVTTGDLNTLGDVQQAFASAAYTGPITLDGVDPSLAALPGDTLGELVRLACIGDTACEQYSSANTGGVSPPPPAYETSLFLISPPRLHVTRAYSQSLSFPSRGAVKEPSTYSLGTLAANIGAQLGPQFSQSASFTTSQDAVYGNTCINQDLPCFGDNRDAIYSSTSKGGDSFGAAGDDVFVVFGVDHRATGNTTYTNVTIYDDPAEVGVKAMTSPCPPSGPCLPGSAAAFGVSGPYYAAVFARDCTPSYLAGTACTEVPSSGWPSLPAGAGLSFTERAYLNPQNNPIRPDPSYLVTPQVLHYWGLK